MRTKGYQTSEFWFTLVSFIISGLFIFGVITEADTKDDLISVSTHVVESIILIGGQFALFSRYRAKRKRWNITQLTRGRSLFDIVPNNYNLKAEGERIRTPEINRLIFFFSLGRSQPSKGATLRYMHLDEFCPRFYTSLFYVCFNLLHP